MASSMALRRATTTTASSLFRKFINPTTLSTLPHQNRFIFPPPPPLYLAATRFFTTTTSSSSDNKDSDSSVIIRVYPQKFKTDNPFQSGGPRNMEINMDKNGMLVRVALPGVGDNGIKVWAENNFVYFAGEGDIEHENDACGRKYGGSLEVRLEDHRADGFNAEMKNGILRLMVPKAESKGKRSIVVD